MKIKKVPLSKIQYFCPNHFDDLQFDLVRWSWLDDQAEVENLRARDADFEFFEIGKSIFLPIPIHEINNNPNLVQNPGY